MEKRLKKSNEWVNKQLYLPSDERLVCLKWDDGTLDVGYYNHTQGWFVSNNELSPNIQYPRYWKDKCI